MPALYPRAKLGPTLLAAAARSATIHGIRPGPLLISERPDLFWGTITSMYLLLLILNLPLVGVFVQILRIPYPLLTPGVLLLCLIGAYSVTGSGVVPPALAVKTSFH